MKLLIVTQVVDTQDPVLGFFHEWLCEFATHVDSLEVICLREGTHALPQNVRVHSLGKEKGRLTTILYAMRFKWLAWKLLRSYDTVFVHMNPEYFLIGGPIWKLFGKHTSLWYLHKSVPLSLRLALPFIDTVFTASKESFRLKTKKLRIVGHGITVQASSSEVSDGCELVTLGRISPSKGYEYLFDALTEIEGVPLAVYGPNGNAYQAKLSELSQTKDLSGKILFEGPVSHQDVGKALAGHALFLHASRGTGSLDKAPLEAMLAGVPVLSSSPAFRDLLIPYGLFVEGDAHAYAEALKAFLSRSGEEKARIARELSDYVRETHALPALITRILAELAPRT